MFNDNNLNQDEFNEQINNAKEQINDIMNEHGDEIKKGVKKAALGIGLWAGVKIATTGLIIIGIPVLIHKVNKMEKSEAQSLADAMFD